MSKELTPAAREQKRQQAQVVHEAAQVLEAHHASQELISTLLDWADEIAPNQGE